MQRDYDQLAARLDAHTGNGRVSSSHLSLISHAAERREWPEPLAPEAYQRLIGGIVRAVEPQTESDPAAVLLQVLVSFGALVGRGPHVRVEGDEHHLNLF